MLAWQMALSAPQRWAGVITMASSPRFVATEGWPGVAPSVLQGFARSLHQESSRTVERFLAIQPPDAFGTGRRAPDEGSIGVPSCTYPCGTHCGVGFVEFARSAHAIVLAIHSDAKSLWPPGRFGAGGGDGAKLLAASSSADHLFDRLCPCPVFDRTGGCLPPYSNSVSVIGAMTFTARWIG